MEVTGIIKYYFSFKEQLEQEVISKTGIPKKKFFFDVSLNTDSPDLDSYDCEYTYQDVC